MNFRKNLKKTFRETERKEQEEKARRIEEMARTDEEWGIVKRYISNCILEKASKPYSAIKYSGLRGKWMFLSSDSLRIRNSNIIINWKDMERFCKEKKLKLRYGLNTSFGPGEDILVKDNKANSYVSYYLVKVS